MIKYRRNVAGSLLALMLLLQVSSAIHFATTDHKLCEHGQVVDAHDCDDDGHEHEGEDPRHSGEGHDDCQMVVYLTSAGAMCVNSFDVPPVTLSPGHDTPVRVERRVTSSAEIYTFSPSNSPPSA